MSLYKVKAFHIYFGEWYVRAETEAGAKQIAQEQFDVRGMSIFKETDHSQKEIITITKEK